MEVQSVERSQHSSGTGHSIVLSLDKSSIPVSKDLLSSEFSAATFKNKDGVFNSKHGTHRTLFIDSSNLSQMVNSDLQQV
jgi:hypothetical protein